jgi:hypothetical protein
MDNSEQGVELMRARSNPNIGLHLSIPAQVSSRLVIDLFSSEVNEAFEIMIDFPNDPAGVRTLERRDRSRDIYQV